MTRTSALALALIACGPPPTTFTEVREELLLTSCALSSCHGSGTGDLTLDATAPEAMYAELVDVPSVHDPSILRVKPGDADNSYLVLKLEGTQPDASDQNEPMPPPFGLLDADPDLVARVRSWIDAGALDD